MPRSSALVAISRHERAFWPSREAEGEREQGLDRDAAPPPQGARSYTALLRTSKREAKPRRERALR